eukprot:CAMPEP_0171676418 /NCGR_PEP_ID=MMETSP0990-20121206/54422_1 /TAXON_ID=483369 /ORGANISM="non described non described, Strain CCMP2098" /LENGTH=62 /DNA_ID=CAMNT_0012262593 /DNA_START=164 /DNA_END=349 /DNA_ORIENTATION=-
MHHRRKDSCVVLEAEHAFVEVATQPLKNHRSKAPERLLLHLGRSLQGHRRRRWHPLTTTSST